MRQEPRIRIQLTDEQKRQIREATAREVDAIELNVEELEERISPTTLSYGNVEWTYKSQ